MAASAFLSVGYRLAVDPERLELFRTSEGPRPAARGRTAEQLAAEALAAAVPYVCVFDEVVMSDPRMNRHAQWFAKDRRPKGDKPAISEAVLNWLFKEYGNSEDPPMLTLLGFSPHVFWRILAAEASLPQIGRPLRALENCLKFVDFEEKLRGDLAYREYLPLKALLALRTPTIEEEATAWQAKLKPWTRPGVQPDVDNEFVMLLADQFGLLG